jgi:hypothetical protein
MGDERKERLQHLRSLAGQPAARSAYAATLLSPRCGTQVVRAALKAISSGYLTGNSSWDSVSGATSR